MVARPCSSTGQSNGLLNRRLQVRVLPRVHGAVAQWLERRPYKAGVVGSIPTSPTDCLGRSLKIADFSSIGVDKMSICGIMEIIQ